MKFITTTEAGKKWGLSSRRIGVLCSEGRIAGVQKVANTWLIPEDAEKPTDARIEAANTSRQAIRRENKWLISFLYCNRTSV